MSKSDVNIRDIIKEEYKRCLIDPIYFMRKYVKIQHPIKGTLNFDLYPFQEDTLKDLVKNDFNIILKSRQMGITTLTSAYTLWMMIFHNDKNILCISIKQETSKEIVTRVRFANNNLPSWLKVPAIEDNRLSLRLKNGSQVKATSSSGDAGRSSALSLLIVDECAFIENIEPIWLSAQSTLSTGGKAILLSCVTKDTFLFTSNGIKQIKDFIPNENVGDYEIDEYSILGKDKCRSGNLFKCNGYVDTIKIISKFSSLEGSQIHKVWAIDNSSKKSGWKQLKDLQVGDFISIQHGSDVWGNNDDINFIPYVSPKIKNKLEINKIDKYWSYLFGLYIAEGSAYKVYSKDGKLVGGTITITCGDPNITWIFDKLNLKYSSSDNLHYALSSKNLIKLFEDIGFDLNKHAHEKEIPSRLLEMSKENISYLLKGIFDGDGCSSGGDISIYLSSRHLIEQIRNVLLNFGILSSFYLKEKSKMNLYDNEIKFNHDIYGLEIYGKYSLKFFNEIGFCIERKQNNKNILIEKSLNRGSSKNIIPYSMELVKKLYRLSGETTSSIRKKFGLNLNGVLNKRRKYKSEHLCRENVLLIYNLYKHLLSEDERSYWDNIIDESVVWDVIKSIEFGKDYTYDFSLPNDSEDFWCHSIIYNGIIGHQTPNGVGNFFHKTWVEAEEGKNKFNTIRLPWYLHPERDQNWRDEQTSLLGQKGAAQECDCLWGNSMVEIFDKFQNKTIKISLEELYYLMG